MRWHWYWPPSPATRGLRRRLSAFGAGWASSPLRKLVQAASLALFLALLFWVLWPYRQDAAGAFARREVVEAEAFLALDPLVSLSASIAARTAAWSLAWAGALLAASVLLPRLFCGYLCPLGTCIDLADWAVGRHVRRGAGPTGRRWTSLKYAVLIAVLAAAVAGVTLSGYVAPIPVLTRGLGFLLGPPQLRAALGADAAGPMPAAAVAAVALLAAVLATTLLGRRFWCRVLCPTGAIFALAARVGLMRRRVTDRCTDCGECAESCPFDAIRPDRATDAAECVVCQQCAGVCPTGAIEFVGRFYRSGAGRAAAPAAGGGGISRRAVIVGAAAGVTGGLALAGAARGGFGGGAAISAEPPVRPPGSLPERRFLAACVRCGSCIKGCPTGVLVPTGAGRGFDALWTPRLDCDRAGCAPDCNVCGQACPTGAIRALPMAEKRLAHIGLAEVNTRTCRPHAGKGQCRLCVDACKQAGYDAIEFRLVGVEVDASGMPVEDTGTLAPVLIPERCVGCGLCQAVCHKVNVRQLRVLGSSAIVVRATGATSTDAEFTPLPSVPPGPSST